MPLPPRADPHAEWWTVVATEPDDIYHGIIFQKCTKPGAKKTSRCAVEHILVKALDPTLAALIRRAPSDRPLKRRRLLDLPDLKKEEEAEGKEQEGEGDEHKEVKQEPQQH